MGQGRIKKLFLERISYKIFETSSKFWCEMADHEKSLMAIFQDHFASFPKMLIFLGGLGTKLLFYIVEILSWYLGISQDPKS